MIYVVNKKYSSYCRKLIERGINYLQVCEGRQIPLDPYDVEAFGLLPYYPYTMPELLLPIIILCSYSN